jgi:competence protein ComEC
MPAVIGIEGRHHRRSSNALLSGAFWLALAAGCREAPSTPQPSGPAMAGAGAGAGAGAVGNTAAGMTSQAGAMAGSVSAGTSSVTPGGSGSGGAGAGQSTGGGGGAETEPQSPLRIYWIDVEGGAATLLIAPNGEVVLVDAGFPGARDPGRIAKVLTDEVHADHIDHLICTHYHTDHVGGIPTLAGMFPVSHFYDHGGTVQQSQDFDNYVKTAGDKRVLTKPGDKLTLGGLALTFVTAAGVVIEPPLPGANANDTCPSNVTKSMDGGAENAQSLGFVANFGKFSFLDLGDITWAVEQQLMCPTNRIGNVDLFQVSHHGLDISNSPQLVHALAPTVAVMNNGATKGGASSTFDTLKASPGLQALWALHQVPANDAAHNAEEALTANLAGADDAHWIKAVIEANGAYTITNSRNGMSRTYAARQ